MHLKQITINNFRNIIDLSCDFTPTFNIFYGKNGSGKTSILEAIHFLGLGRSFRTRHINRVIQHEREAFTLFGNIQQAQHLTLSIGMSRARDGNHQNRIAGQPVTSLTEIARTLPLQTLTPNSHRLLTDGPKARRQFLDWGVFHADPAFLNCWQRATRALQQRNAALKQRQGLSQIQHWNQELISAANLLDKQRKQYMNELIPLFNEYLACLLPNQETTLRYQRGWDKEQDLSEVLERNFTRDQELGHTQSGPHRADFTLKINNIPSQDVLSQGQLKVTAYALKLAQGKLMQNQSQTSCLYLVDDLSAELDETSQQRVLSILKSLNSQIFITTISLDNVSHDQGQAFHLKRGRIELP